MFKSLHTEFKNVKYFTMTLKQAVHINLKFTLVDQKNSCFLSRKFALCIIAVQIHIKSLFFHNKEIIISDLFLKTYVHY